MKTHSVETFSSSCLSCWTATSPRSALRLLFSRHPSEPKAVGVMAAKRNRKRRNVFVSSVLRPSPPLIVAAGCCCCCCWHCVCCSSSAECSTDARCRLQWFPSVGWAHSLSTLGHDSAKATLRCRVPLLPLPEALVAEVVASTFVVVQVRTSPSMRREMRAAESLFELSATTVSGTGGEGDRNPAARRRGRILRRVHGRGGGERGQEGHCLHMVQAVCHGLSECGYIFT